MAVKININNYENFVIDYIEDNLNADDKLEFELFLEKNPEIKEEISDLGGFFVKKDNITYENKNRLKKSPIEGLSYCEYLVISDIEREISDEEKQDLKFAFQHNNQIANEYNNFKKSVLKKEKIIYPNKQSLKRTNIVTFRTANNIITAIAAMLILFFGVKTLFYNNEQTQIKSTTIALEDISFTDYNIKRSNNFFQDNVIENSNNHTEPNRSFQDSQNCYADNNLIDTQTLFIDTNYQQIAIENDLPTRNNCYHLSDLPTNPTLIYASNNIIYDNNKGINIQPDEIINFMFDKFQKITESDRKIKIDFDQNNKCYGIEYNRKSYTICLK